jgi:hypothetical protein
VARKAAQKKNKQSGSNVVATIPKPEGSMNDDYSLIVEMGLEGNKDQFKAIQVRACFVFEVNHVS